MAVRRTCQFVVVLTFILLLSFFLFGLAFAYAQGNPQLAGLITDIPLSPDFSADITQYTASADNGISSISVTPTGASAEAQIDVNGTLITEQQPTAVVPLAVGANTVTITVTEGESSGIYTILVTRAPSGNTALKGLDIDVGYLTPGFNAGVYSYTLTTNGLAACTDGQSVTTASSVFITATAGQADASITINNQAAPSGETQVVPLEMGANTISVAVTAQDGVTKNEYVITANRVDAAWQPLPYMISLSNVVAVNVTMIDGMLYVIHDGKLYQYQNDDVQYQVAIPGIDSDICNLTGWNGIPYLAFRDENGKAQVMGYDGAQWAALGQTGFSDGAAEEIQICADAGGTFYAAYIDVANGRRATVMKYAGNGWEAVGSKAFTAGEVSHLSLALVGGAPALACSDESLGGRGVLWVFDGGAWALAGGAPFSDGDTNSMSLAADGDTPYIVYQDGTCSYRATVRKRTGTGWETLGEPGISPYGGSVDIAVFDGRVHFSSGNFMNEMVYDGHEWISEGSSYSYNITRGIFVKNGNVLYCIYYGDYSASNKIIFLSKLKKANDASVSGIRLSYPQYYDKTLLTPAGTYEYKETVSGYVRSLTIHVNPNDEMASCVVNGKPVNGDADFALDFGENTFTITVTSPDETDTKTYTLKVTREKDNTLRSLAVGAGILTPAFHPDTLQYKVDIDSSVKSIPLSLQLNDTQSTVKINGVPAASGGVDQPIPLSVGQNVITVAVTSSDGSLSRTYTLTVNRAAWSWQREGGISGTDERDYAYYRFVDGIPTMVVVKTNKPYNITVLKCFGATWETVCQYPVSFFYECSFASWEKDIYIRLDDAIFRVTGSALEKVCMCPYEDVSAFTIYGGMPFVAYEKDDDKLYVSKYAAGEWLDVCGSPVYPENAWQVDLVVDNGIPYVAFNFSSGSRAVVRKLDGAQWVTLGENTLPVRTEDISLYMNNGIPYLASDYYSRKPALLKYTGGQWEPVGASSLPNPGYVTYNVSFNGETPYIQYHTTFRTDTDVLKYDGSQWLRVGDLSVSYVNIDELTEKLNDLTIENGTPYLLSRDKGYSIIKYQLANNAGLLRVGISGTEGLPAYSAGAVNAGDAQELDFEVPCYMTSVRLDPVAADRYATVTMDGEEIPYGDGRLAELQPGTNTHSIRVVSCDGTVTREYTLRILRKPDASLQSLSAESGSLNPAFHPDVYRYSMSVDGLVGSVRLSATPLDSSAVVRVNGAELAGTAELSLHAGTNTFDVSVTSADGANTQHYTVDIVRTAYTWQGFGQDPLPHAHDTLSLDIFKGEPYIAFTGPNDELNVMRYDGAEWVRVGNISADNIRDAEISVDKTTGAVYAVYMVGNSSQLMKVLKYTQASGWSYLDCSAIAPEPVEDARLCAESGSLFIAYRKGSVLYTARYNGTGWENLGDSGVRAGAGSDYSFVMHNGELYIGGVDDIALVRKYGVSGWEDVWTASVPSDISEFSMASGGEELAIAYCGNSTGWMPVVMKLTSDGWSVLKGIPPKQTVSCPMISLCADSSSVTLYMYGYFSHNTSQAIQYRGGTWSTIGLFSGNAFSDYAGGFMRNGGAVIAFPQNGGSGIVLRQVPIRDSTLTGFKLSGEAVISTMGNPDRTDYDYSTVSDTISVTPFTSDANAAVSVNGVSVGNHNTSEPIPLDIGQNTITITVVPLDGTAGKTYLLHVRRLSTDSTLSSLGMDDLPVPGFAPDKYDYDLGALPGVVGSVMINAEAGFPGAAVSGAGLHSLNYGPNTLAVTVTAEDGVTVTEYQLHIYRQSDDSKLSSVTIDGVKLDMEPGKNEINFGTVEAGKTSVALSAATADAHAALTCPGVWDLAYGDNTCTVKVVSEDASSTTSYTLRIRRQKPSDNVEILKEGNGTVYGGGIFYLGDTVTVSAAPSEGYVFKQWRIESGNVQLDDATSSTVTFTMPLSRVTLTAVFGIVQLGVPAPSASSAGYNSIEITWPEIPGASGYEVWRSNSASGNLEKIASPTETHWLDTGLKTGEVYYYSIRAFNAAVNVCGDHSSPIRAIPALAAPSPMNASMASYNGIKLTWGAVAGATKYEVYRSISGAGAFKLLTVTKATSYAIAGVSTGTAYYYKVRACRLVGQKKLYGSYSVVASCKTALGAPGAVKAVTSNYFNVKITWGKVAGASRYEIYRCETSEGNYTLLGSMTGASYMNKNLNNGASYYYKVRAYRTVSGKKVYGPYSAAVNGKAAHITVAAPSAAAEPVTSNSIKIRWRKVSGATRYELYCATSAVGTFKLVASTTALSCTNKGLNTGTEYFYKVRAYRLVSGKKIYSVYSDVVSARPVFSAKLR